MLPLILPCLWVELNGASIGCRFERIEYVPSDRELRIGTVRVRNPGLQYFPRERAVRVTGHELSTFADGFE